MQTKKSPTAFLREKRLYDEYLDWAKKEKIIYDKVYFRRAYWAKSVAKDAEHTTLYQQIRAAGYYCSCITKILKSYMWRIAVEKDGHVARLYVDNKYDLGNKEFLDRIFQDSKTEQASMQSSATQQEPSLNTSTSTDQSGQ